MEGNLICELCDLVGEECFICFILNIILIEWVIFLSNSISEWFFKLVKCIIESRKIELLSFWFELSEHEDCSP